MSFTSSPELVAESSPDIYLDTDASEPSSASPTPKKSCSPDNEMGPCRSSPSSATFDISMVDPTEAELTSWLAGFHAKTSASPAKEMDSTGSAAVSGQRWPGSLARYDHDTRSWRTAQYSLLGGLVEYSATWPAWGSMRNGECWERTMPELRTCGTDFGLWPTPCATDSSDRKVGSRMHETKNGTFKHIGKNGTLSQVRLSQVVKHRTPDGVGRMNPDWVEWLMGWPIGHTELKPLAMDKFHEWQQQHGKS